MRTGATNAPATRARTTSAMPRQIHREQLRRGALHQTSGSDAILEGTRRPFLEERSHKALRGMLAWAPRARRRRLGRFAERQRRRDRRKHAQGEAGGGDPALAVVCRKLGADEAPIAATSGSATPSTSTVSDASTKARAYSRRALSTSPCKYRQSASASRAGASVEASASAARSASRAASSSPPRSSQRPAGSPAARPPGPRSSSVARPTAHAHPRTSSGDAGAAASSASTRLAPDAIRWRYPARSASTSSRSARASAAAG